MFTTQGPLPCVLFVCCVYENGMPWRYKSALSARRAGPGTAAFASPAVLMQCFDMRRTVVRHWYALNIVLPPYRVLMLLLQVGKTLHMM